MKRSSQRVQWDHNLLSELLQADQTVGYSVTDLSLEFSLYRTSSFFSFKFAKLFQYQDVQECT